ncbi:hypothetical protein DSO57_1019782 [Entomophthora muscae]|uniref:Uncharacterized protein n=1 Tax=Entomophthora muscae TaxID=34485 RepID=A0ACC2UDW7_9FUNG|nr:hypothetical protein DSO57_1019782 [Entomophthora muscae]
MEDIKKLVTDLVAKQSSVLEENKTITKGLIVVSSMMDNYSKEMEELEHFCQQITSIASSSQKAQSVSTSSNTKKQSMLTIPRRRWSRPKKPKNFLRNPVVMLSKKDKGRETNNQEHIEKSL